MSSPHITVDPEIHSGTPVFTGTRVAIKTLFDHLKAGDALEVFLDDFPSVSRDVAVAVLEEARAALLPDAHPACRVRPSSSGVVPAGSKSATARRLGWYEEWTVACPGCRQFDDLRTAALLAAVYDA